jgi:hypothetical protein
MKNDLELFGIRLHPDYRVSTKTRIYEKGLGLSSAVTGILFLLVSMNHKKELPVEVQEFYRERLAGFDPAAFLQEEAVSASIFNGTAGIAITTCLAWQLNWIDSDFNLDHLLQQCFKTKADTLDFSTGIAGQGIALLFSQKIKEINSARPLLSGYIDSLLNEQASNGSWPLLNTIDKKYDLRLISGIAGVLYLLLEYYQHRKDESVQKAIEKGLHWLSRKAKIRNHKYYWPIQHQGTKAYNQTLARGCGGIALLFLKAYQYLSHEKYRKIVEGTLSGISETPVWTEYGLSNGLAGLGVVYLEAATICKNRYWLTRAGWIATILVHSSSEQDKKCWNPGAGQEFDPSLLTGNTGIIYFLNRYKNQL